ncbi:hypothetical protein E2C11_18940 [Streptomyces lavendulae]|nr:hypothetical protein [Streptomyces lavendulae]TXJ75917.1 hypothetical protein E2C11_18940 [Streptomyces lavendulae]
MTYRRTGPGGGATRRSWAAVLALLAAFVVLVHHDVSAAPAAPATAMSAMPGMDHTARNTTVQHMTARHMATHRVTGHRVTGQDMAVVALSSAMGHDTSGACSGMQHCTSGAVGSPQWLDPPAVPTHTAQAVPPRGVLAGRGLPGNPYRAPPDLSVLSRLLI